MRAITRCIPAALCRMCSGNSIPSRIWRGTGTGASSRTSSRPIEKTSPAPRLENFSNAIANAPGPASINANIVWNAGWSTPACNAAARRSNIRVSASCTIPIFTSPRCSNVASFMQSSRPLQRPQNGTPRFIPYHSANFRRPLDSTPASTKRVSPPAITI